MHLQISRDTIFRLFGGGFKTQRRGNAGGFKCLREALNIRHKDLWITLSTGGVKCLHKGDSKRNAGGFKCLREVGLGGSKRNAGGFKCLRGSSRKLLFYMKKMAFSKTSELLVSYTGFKLTARELF